MILFLVVTHLFDLILLYDMVRFTIMILLRTLTRLDLLIPFSFVTHFAEMILLGKMVRLGSVILLTAMTHLH